MTTATALQITVSEDLNASKRNPMRFCATLDNDTNSERAGFGSSERNALWELAKALNIHPGTLSLTASIERVALR